MKQKFYLMLCLLIAGTAGTIAQVTIGSSNEPHSAAILDLQTSNKGLKLPVVSLGSDKTIFTLDPETDKATASGMMIYNKEDDKVYVWNGKRWQVIAGSTSSTGGDDDGSGISVDGGRIPTVAANGGIATISLISDCSNTGGWTITLKSGTGASLKKVNTDTGTFTIEFTSNTSVNKRKAEVAVADACGNSRVLAIYQAGHDNGNDDETTEVEPTLNLPLGTGFFKGKVCFDIAAGNNGTNSCAPLTSRSKHKTDFTNRTEQDSNAETITTYSGVQVYTFTPSGAISNVRFSYIEVDDAENKAIESVTAKADYTGNHITTPCKVTVKFKESLNNDLKGLTSKNAMKVYLYVVYNNAQDGTGEDVHLKLIISLQDCTCCGAPTVDGRWLDFMCHNLGADESLDPFTHSIGLYGSLFQWGRTADGHEYRDAPTVATSAQNAELGSDGQVVHTSTRYGKFITNTVGTTYYDWRTPQDSSLWKGIVTGKEIAKAAGDPCPSGWKIPSKDQWLSIFNGTGSGASSAATATTWVWDTNNGGYKVGDLLYLPAAGSRLYNTGAVSYVGTTGYYWSSTPGTNLTYSNNLYINSTHVNPITQTPRGTGVSVRCVNDAGTSPSSYDAGKNKTGITTEDGYVPNVAAAGGTVPMSLNTTCNRTGAWAIMIKSGTGATLQNVDEANGLFDLKFDANPNANPRTVIVTVRDACSNAQDLIFTQDGKTEDLSSTLTLGAGTFRGKTGFDIAYSNSGMYACGLLTSGRTYEKTVFSNRTPQDQEVGVKAPYSGVQVYTFTPPASGVSNVRFSYVEKGEAKGNIIKGMSPQKDYSGTYVTTPCKLTIEYNEELDKLLRGVTRKNSFEMDLYVIYNDKPDGSGKDVYLKLVINLQDCVACGARTTAGGWLEFMCHNLGADESLDPFTHSIGLYGDLYQWGRKKDGHQSRTSEIIANAAANAELDVDGQVTETSTRYGKFITNTVSTTFYDWRTPQDSTLWGGERFLDSPKTTGDPCPEGWRVPTQAQWASISAATSGVSSATTGTTWTWDGVGGYKVGASLYLPAAGSRLYNTGVVSYVGTTGYYWSSTPGTNLTYSNNLYINSTHVNPITQTPRGTGASVRCVKTEK